MKTHTHTHTQRLERLDAAYYIAIALNIGYVAAETCVALVHGSAGLLSDAGHKLMDVFSLLIALLAFKLASSRPSQRRTYGLRKVSVLISLVNALLLAAVVLAILVESASKLAHPSPVDGAAISWTAAAGILVSGISALLLGRFKRGDINTRGAFLHMATDSLMSLGVVLSGVVISVTGWSVLDPLVGVVISSVMLAGAVKLVIDSFGMIIDSVPEGIDPSHVRELILSCRGVEGIDELHIWPVSIFETALSARVRVHGAENAEHVPDEIRLRLSSEGIQQSTVEVHLI